MPTREDVDLARAAIDRGFLTIKESVKCLEIQRDHEANGRQVSLDRIFVEAQFLTENQVAMLKDNLAKAAALRHVGPYEVLSRVGAGGMGTVYKARDTKADRIVALKILSPAHANNKEYIQRFLREAHASGQLSHPNIVQGIDAGEANGQYYFAMEFIDGTTVGDMLKDGRALPEQQALDIAIQIAKALEHAEAHHLVHRDIKPDNIMITKDGTAKLADLGLARLTTVVESGEQKSFGTAYYASPEQCQGLTNEVDTQSDMYSFGATLFHMLAGKVPFNDESPEAIMARHIEDRRPYLKDMNVQLSHGISKIVRKLMAVQKKDRYTAMASVVNDLTLVRMGRSPKLGEGAADASNVNRYRSPTGSWRIKSPAKQKKMMWIIIVSSVVAAGIIFGGFLWLALRPGTDAATLPGVTREKTAEDLLNEEADAVFQKDIQPLLATGSTASAWDRYFKLRTFADGKYKGTSSGGKALNEAGLLERDLEKQGQPTVDRLKTTAAGLEGQLKFRTALETLDQLPVECQVPRLLKQIEESRKLTVEHAEAKFAELSGKADGLARDKKFKDAIDIYTSIASSFGLPKFVDPANVRIKELKKAMDEAGAAEQKQKAEEAARLAAEQAKEKVRQDKLALKAAIVKAKELSVQAKYAEAATALRDAAAASADPSKDALGHAASDLDAAAKLLGSIRKNESIKDRVATISLRSGDAIQGTVFRIDETGVSLQIESNGTKTLQRFPWSDISVEGFKNLAGMARPLSAADHYAFASLFFFTGAVDKADKEIDAAAADPAEKASAERRKADITALTALAAYTGN